MPADTIFSELRFTISSLKQTGLPEDGVNEHGNALCIINVLCSVHRIAHKCSSELPYSFSLLCYVSEKNPASLCRVTGLVSLTVW